MATKAPAPKHKIDAKEWAEINAQYSDTLKQLRAMPEGKDKEYAKNILRKTVQNLSGQIDLEGMDPGMSAKGPLDFVGQSLNYGTDLLLTQPLALALGGATELATGKDIVRKDDVMNALKGPFGPGATSYPEYLERAGVSPGTAKAVDIPIEMAVSAAPNLIARFANPEGMIAKLASWYAPAGEMGKREALIKEAQQTMNPDDFRRYMREVEKVNPQLPNTSVPVIGKAGAAKTAFQTVADPLGMVSSRGARAYGDTAFSDADQAARESGGAPWKPSDVAYRNGVSGWTKQDLINKIKQSIGQKTELREGLINQVDVAQEGGRIPKTPGGKFISEVEKRIDNNPELPPALKSQLGEAPAELPPKTGVDEAKAQINKDFYPYSEQPELTIQEIDDLRRSANQGGGAAGTWSQPQDLPNSTKVDTSRTNSSHRYGYGVLASTAGDYIENLLEKASAAGEHLGTQEHALSKELQAMIIARNAMEESTKTGLLESLKKNPVSAAITVAPGVGMAAASKITGYKPFDLAALVAALGAGAAANSTAAKTKLGYGLSRISPYSTPALKAGATYMNDERARAPSWDDLLNQLEQK